MVKLVPNDGMLYYEFYVLINKHNVDDCAYEDYNEALCDCGDGKIVVRVNLKVHENIFEPLTCSIEVPEDMVPKAIDGKVDEIDIPITFNDEKVPITIKEKLVSGCNGIVAFIKRKIFNGENETDWSPVDLKQAEYDALIEEQKIKLKKLDVLEKQLQEKLNSNE